jgi:molybdopterin-containing oxidoreductase family membrane subunit
MRKALWSLWVIAFALGIVGVFLRLYYGKEVVGYSSYIPWGLWVSLYIYFVGLSAGAFLLSALVYVFNLERFKNIGKLALFTALVSLICALLAIFFDLGRMGRFYKIFTSPNFSSMMAWMVWLYSAYFLLLLAELWLVMRNDLRVRAARPGFIGKLAGWLSLGELARGKEQLLVKILATLGVPLAVAFHGGVGALFGVLGARPYWHSSLFPILFLASALLTGGALLAFIVVTFWPRKDSQEYRELCHALGRITLGLLALYMLLESSEFIINLYGSIPAVTDAFKLMLFGPFWWAFWFIYLGLGVLIPVLILVAKPRSVRWIGLATFLVAFSFISMRLNIVIPGLAVPELKAFESAYVDARLNFDYFPNLTEWLVAFFVASFGFMIFYLGYKYLPIFAREEEV